MNQANKKSTTILYIGRFQPFHLGHLDAVYQAFEKGATQLIFGIGSVNIPKSEKNPWTATERIEMIKASLKDRGVDPEKVDFFRIPDFSDDEDRYTYIVEQCPSFDLVMSGNPWVIDVFTSQGQAVFEQAMRIDINATQIRAWLDISEFEQVGKYVTPGVLSCLHGFLEPVDAEERIKQVIS